MHQLPAFWAIVKKDLAIWFRSPSSIAVTVLPALILMLVLILQAAAVTGSPVAIVNEDGGGQAAAKLVKIAEHYNGFYTAEVMSKNQAEQEYQNLRVAGVLIIPHGFSTALATGQRPTVTWQVRNFNNDTANDLRRALPDIFTTFLHSGAAGINPLQIQVQEHDIHRTDASFVGFNMIAVVVMLILQAGIVNAGLAAVREWETGSVKELLTSPARPLTMIVGKVVAGVVASDITGGVALVCAIATGVVHLPNTYLLLAALVIMTLTAVVGSGIGVLFGSALRSTERVSGLSISLSFYLFFLAGGITDIAYLPRWLQEVAAYIPNTYSLDALRETMLYGSASGVLLDAGVLAVAAVITLAVGIPVMRRGLSH
ncbi:ABC transporter permease [Alicyclobacillus mengziensis]|uniref:ABC transporter permease n=1 Tax=Alicyclobacillus mengziensis TaxID=2931921 RepID=A0A9X7Z7V9_9BACL|nr:ABC transporter permease [Alicyclobacillus mengziensis]QSO48872.1 ABC transporter permease [Alicyclobacillus mengziensis]